MIRQLNSGRWNVRIKHNGKHLVSRTFDRKKDAQKWEQQQKLALASGTWTDPRAGEVTVEVYLPLWLDTKTLAASTLEGYEAAIRRHIIPVFGHRPLSSIPPSEMQAWAVNLAKTSRTAARRSLGIMRGMYRMAVADGFVARSPADYVELPSLRRGEPNPLTQDEVVRLVDATPNDRDKLMIQVLAFGGLRFGELAALGPDSIHDHGLHLTRSVQHSSQGPGVIWGDLKTHQARTVPLPSKTLAALRQRASDLAADELIFSTTTGTVISRRNWSNRVLTVACKQAGIKRITPHDLRDTAATTLLAARIPIAVVSRILGHESPATTMRHYAGVTSSDRDLVQNFLDQLG